MLSCLDRFCNAFREKVSKEKTKIFFSKKVSPQLVDLIGAQSSFENLVVVFGSSNYSWPNFQDYLCVYA